MLTVEAVKSLTLSQEYERVAGDKETASKFKYGDKPETPLFEETGFEQRRQTRHEKLKDSD